ncbi:MAG: bacillithiol biosynthesis cysteine-adding enzyme BshC [candidate division Zixibacteria bacterium]|nr:bacillithiol biosynthesis cysteine-adding enzyme BshC [candidate division Zixibacteria bacterium]
MTAPALIPFTEALGFSRLFQDFTYRPDTTAPLFGTATPADAAAALGRRDYRRSALIDILHRQNHSWGAPEAVDEVIRKLADPKAVAVVTAHQACLFGGPYMILLKALAAEAWARRLEKQLAVPVTPIFWIAGDDHDFKETAVVDLFDRQGRPARLALDWDDSRLYSPVGRLTYDQSIARETAKLRELLPDNDFKTKALEPIERAYRKGDTPVDCFARYLHHLIGRLGIVLFNPHDESAKRPAAPLMQEIIRRRRDVGKVLSTTETALTAAGYHIQVRKASDAAHLFYHAPGRTAIHYQGNDCRVGEKIIPEQELLKAIEAAPNDFSPDVITRPLVQSHLFPTVAVVGGPAEVAYYAQLMPLFDLFALVPPRVLPRPSMTLVEGRFEKLMSRSAIGFEEIAVRADEVVNRLMDESFPTDLDHRLKTLKDTVRGRMMELTAALTSFDPQLRDTAARAGEKMDYLLNELEKKVFAAHKKKNAADREKILQARDHLFPNRGLAERSIAPVYFLSRYGPTVIETIRKNLPLEETGHRLLMLSEYYG